MGKKIAIYGGIGVAVLGAGYLLHRRSVKAGMRTRHMLLASGNFFQQRQGA